MSVYEDAMVPKSPFKIFSIIKDISNFANKTDISSEEKLMILIPLCADYKAMPTNTHGAIGDFLEQIITSLENGYVPNDDE